MATNDNRAMVEAARAYYDKVLDYSAATIIELMAGFASEQSALAVAAERTRMIGDLMTLYAESESMTEFGEEAHAYLRGSTDE